MILGHADINIHFLVLRCKQGSTESTAKKTRSHTAEAEAVVGEQGR